MSAVKAQETPLITGEAYALMSECDTSELVKGRVVPMSPAGFDHGKSEGRGFRHIDDFVHAHDLGEVAVGEVGLYTSRDPDTVRGADILFISHATFARRNPALAFLDVAPELIVEVLSPTNTMREFLEKLAEYMAIGVRLVWLVDPRKRCVHAYRSLTDVRTFRENDLLPGDDVLPGFSMPVGKWFD